MRNTLHRFGIATLCLLALASQQAARADDGKPEETKPVAIAQNLKAKDSVQYKVITTITGGADVTVEQNRKYTVKEIKDNGNIVSTIANLGGKVNLNGADQEIPPGAPVALTQSKNGSVLTYTPETDNNPYFSAATLNLLEMIDHIILPEKPVKPGDSWTTEVDNPAVKGKKVKIKTTYVKADKVEGVAAWKIKQTLEADTEGGGDKLTSETIALLDASNGQLIQAEDDVKAIPARMGVIDWKSKIQRVKPDAAKTEKQPD